jgi:hypothetical protein
MYIYFTLVWWCTPVIPALERLIQEDHNVEANKDYIVRHCFKTKQNEQTKPKKKKTNQTTQ